ncbi:hypothetical protein XI25_20480 [Paenibacillus sp. DMB20]|nr:hypothetical protein XI25_20480 [Paenibacillus sp. DMB20]
MRSSWTKRSAKWVNGRTVENAKLVFKKIYIRQAFDLWIKCFLFIKYILCYNSNPKNLVNMQSINTYGQTLFERLLLKFGLYLCLNVLVPTNQVNIREC